MIIGELLCNDGREPGDDSLLSLGNFLNVKHFCLLLVTFDAYSRVESSSSLSDIVSVSSSNRFLFTLFSFSGLSSTTFFGVCGPKINKQLFTIKEKFVHAAKLMWKQHNFSPDKKLKY